MNKPVIYAGVIVLLAAVGIGLIALTTHDGTDGGNAVVNETNETKMIAAAVNAVEDGTWSLSGPGPVWELYTADDGTLYSFQGPYGNTIRAISPDDSVEWTYQVSDEWRVSNVITRPFQGNFIGIPFNLEPVYSVDNDVLYLYIRENKITDFNHYPYEVYPVKESPDYLLKERLMAISGGKLLWDVPLSDEHHFFEDSYVYAQNGRVYVFDDYSVSVFNASGSKLFRIDNASAPPAIDENGNIYVVPAIPTALPLDIYVFSEEQDVTFHCPANVLQSYNPDGTLIWEEDLGAGIGPLNMGNDTIPVYRDHTLYIRAGSNVMAMGTYGNVIWSVDQLDPVAEDLMFPKNATMRYIQPSKGYPYLVWTGNGVDNASLTLSIPSWANFTEFYPHTGIDRWGVDIPLNGTVVTMDMANVEKLVNVMGPAPIDGNRVLTSNLHNSTYSTISSNGTVYAEIFFIDYEQPTILNASKCYYASVICAVDKSSGTLLWYKPLDAFVTCRVVNNDTLYYGTHDGRIFGGITRDKPAPSIVAAAIKDDMGKVAGIVAGGASVTAAAVLFIKMFALGGLTRARGQLTKNDNRNRVLEYIVSHPGSTMYEISHGLGLNVGTIRYHLLILSLNHRVATFQSDGKYVRYFTNAGSFSKDEQFYLSLVRRDPMRRILDLLIDKAEMSNQEISEALDMHDSASSRYLKELAARGLVLKRDATGGRTAYSIRHEYRDPIETALERIDNN